MRGLPSNAHESRPFSFVQMLVDVFLSDVVVFISQIVNSEYSLHTTRLNCGL